MKPWETIDRALTPDGTELTLARRDQEWVVRIGGAMLMSSRMHGSEESLASEALTATATKAERVLIGGMGLGFTLRAVLDRVGPGAIVTVAELVPAVVMWNRKHVGALAGNPLSDPRVRIHEGDVRAHMAESKGTYDAILLDVDNGPRSVEHDDNEKLYLDEGIRICRAALRKGGVLATWSVASDGGYVRRLKNAGFRAEAKSVAARVGARAQHVIFLAALSSSKGGVPAPSGKPASSGKPGKPDPSGKPVTSTSPRRRRP